MAICSVCGKSFSSKKDLRAHVAAKHPDKMKHLYQAEKKSGSSKAPSASLKTSGSGVGGWISMEEYLGKATAGATLLNIAPGKSGMPRLDNYAVLYDQYAIEKWDVRFTPRVGTTVSGMYVAGIVYSHLDEPKTISEVAALQPKVHHAVWQGGNLAASPQRLMKQKWMYVYNSLGAKEDMIAGKVAIYLDGTGVEVDVWVNYSVRFSGPTASQSDKEFKLVHDGSQWSLNGKVVTSLPDTLSDGYTVDVESNKEVASYFDKLFTAFKTLDNIVQGSVYYYHVIASSFIANAALPALGVPVVMHVVRRPFPAMLPTVRSVLSGAVSASAEADQRPQTAQSEVDADQSGSKASSVSDYECVPRSSQ